MFSDVALIVLILMVGVLILSNYAQMKILNRIEDRQKVQATQINTILRSVSSTQGSLRTRMKSVSVEPILDKPKAAQHYEGRGVKRVTSGGKTDPASGESPPARIGEVKRRSYGGTSGDARSS